jgi:hypothetical protein
MKQTDKKLKQSDNREKLENPSYSKLAKTSRGSQNLLSCVAFRKLEAKELMEKTAVVKLT